jgi:hypothetical protein
MWAWLPASSSKSIALSGRDQSGIYRADKYPAVSTASVVISHSWCSLYPLLSPTKMFTESSNLGPQCAHLELSRAHLHSLNPSNWRIYWKLFEKIFIKNQFPSRHFAKDPISWKPMCTRNCQNYFLCYFSKRTKASWQVGETNWARNHASLHASFYSKRAEWPWNHFPIPIMASCLRTFCPTMINGRR